ncbi:MAG: ABC transporter substrate-binding protein [Bacillota bacterium]|nr:ABC transporter substrate-binding protein [Bacillota bacterium]MDP4160132.1 ABC transporter substrate-binding protein [Bacillota bacterium]
MGRKVAFSLSVALLVISLILGPIGCSTDPAGTPTQAKRDKVILNLQFLPEDPACWVALDKGFWAEQNLDVQIIRGYGSGDTVTKIASKKAEFGIADIGNLILAQAQDNVNVKAVGVFKNSYGGIIIYRDNLGINSPKDLEGKSIIGAASSSVTTFFPAFAKSTGFDPSKVKWQFLDTALHVTAFVQGQADTLSTTFKYVPKVEKLMGKQVKYFSYSKDGGLDRYGEVIIAHQDLIAQNPDLVRRFLAGFLKGVQYSVANPTEVGKIEKKYVPETDPDLAVKMWQTELANKVILGEESKSHGIGWMDKDRMSKTIRMVLDAYNLKQEISPEKVYTTEFLPKVPIYPEK